MYKYLALGFVFVVLGLILSVVLKEPRSDRIWDIEVERVSEATFLEDGAISVSDVRDFTYAKGEIVSADWISEVTLNSEDIVATWFVLEPFPDLSAVGHTLLTFEFADGSAYSFSVEARREDGEAYSGVKGLFNAYELAYTWGTERDFITRRLIYLDHEVYMYPLTLSPEQSERLFTRLLKETNDVAEKPRFYNTLTANCTNVLAQIVNRLEPGTLPWDISWYLTGYSDRYLIKNGFIDIENKEDHSLGQYRDELSEAEYFGKTLREILKGTSPS